MGILNLKEQLIDKLSVEAKKEDKKEQLLVSIRQYRGHTLFEVNKLSGEICKAQFEYLEAHFDDDLKNKTTHKKVLMKKDCYYVSALNEKNVIKKILKL